MWRDVFNFEELGDLLGWVRKYWRNAAGYYELDKYIKFEPLIEIATPVEQLEFGNNPGLYLLKYKGEQLLIAQTPTSEPALKRITIKTSKAFETLPEANREVQKFGCLMIPAFFIMAFVMSASHQSFSGTVLYAPYFLGLILFFGHKSGLRAERDSLIKDLKHCYEFQREKRVE